MTQQEYHDYIENPNTCPFCHSADLEKGHIEVDNREADAAVMCNSCGQGWVEVFKLSHIQTEDAVEIVDENMVEVTAAREEVQLNFLKELV